MDHVLTRLEVPMVSSKLCSPSAVQSFILQRIDSREMDRVPVFKNTTSEERMKFLGSWGGSVPFITVKAGDGISRAGDVRDEAFLVLRGRVQVTYRTTVLGTFGPGSLVGEKEFLSGAKRSLTVVAAPDSDVELMVLARITFLKAMAKTPELAVKFLFNMACELSHSYSENMARMQEVIEEMNASKEAGTGAVEDGSQEVVAGDGGIGGPAGAYHAILCHSVRSRRDLDGGRVGAEAGGGDDGGAAGSPTGKQNRRKRNSIISMVASMARTAEAEGAVLLRRLSVTWDKKAKLNLSHRSRK